VRRPAKSSFSQIGQAIMKLGTTRSLAVAVLALPFIATGVAAQVQQSRAPALPPALAATRAALEKYQDPIVAIREGYFSTLACMDFPQGGMDGEVKFTPGGMGVHFLNLSNIGPTLDSLKPQVLIYEPVGDKLRLVAAEWFVPAEVAKERPSIFGQALLGPMDGHPPIMPAALKHYDLHVWLWKTNPAGVFSSTNPALKCPKGGYSHFEPAAAHHKP
jgi:hypothetical protein